MKGAVRTTIAFPREVLDKTDEAVKGGAAPSRNDFILRALRRELAARERARVDAEFARMAHDPDFQVEDAALTEEMQDLDWAELLQELHPQ